MRHFQTLTSHLGLPMIIATLLLGWILRAFSRRLGEVTKMKPHYRWYYVGDAFIGLAALGHTLYSNAALTGQPAQMLTPLAVLGLFYLPLTLGVLIHLVITWLYWGWLIRKR